METALSSVDFFNRFLNQFIRVFDSTWGRVDGHVGALFGTMVVISIVLTFILGTLRDDFDAIGTLVRKILLIGFFAWLINDWQFLTDVVAKGMTKFGLEAGGSALSVQQFLLEPSKIMGEGLDIVNILRKQIEDFSGLWSFFENIFIAILAIITSIVIAGSYFLMTLAVIITVVEFHLITLATFLLLPFGVFQHTAHLTERVFSMLVAIGLRLLTIAFLVGFVLLFFDEFKKEGEYAVDEMFIMIFASFMLAYVMWKGPTVVSSVVPGGANLSGPGTVFLALANSTIMAIRTALNASNQISSYASQSLSMMKEQHVRAVSLPQRPSGNPTARSSYRGGHYPTLRNRQ